MPVRKYQVYSTVKWEGNNLAVIFPMIGMKHPVEQMKGMDWTYNDYVKAVENEGLKLITPEGSITVPVGRTIVVHNDGTCELQSDKVETVNCTYEPSVRVECPYCAEIMDLYEDGDMSGHIDEAMRCGGVLDVDVECDDCGRIFHVDKIEV